MRQAASASIVRGSSMVEQEAVNFKVAGSNPAPGARNHFLDCLSNTHCTDLLIGLSFRWMHPIQQQGRRMPSRSSDTTRLTCSSRVFCCLTVTVQQIHSLRASGVRLSHFSNAALLAIKAFRRSAGISCATPPEISLAVVVVINIYYLRSGSLKIIPRRARWTNQAIYAII